MTAFTDLVGTDLPIIQAPMAGAQRSAMAVAVSGAGGLGSLPCAMLSPEEIRAELTAIRAGTDKPYNVNFFCHRIEEPDARAERVWRTTLSPYYREYGVDPDNIPSPAARGAFDAHVVSLLEEFRPTVVSFHFGLPEPTLVDRVKALGAMILCSATSVAEGRWLEARGVDAIIAQGVEAGGHRGMFLSEDLTTQVGTLALVPQMVNAVSVPVVAAGGIADSRGVAAVLRLGASAVQVGTAYLLCPEATISELHRSALKSERGLHTALTNVFTGRPARGIVNRLIREVGPIASAAPTFPHAVGALAPLRSVAESRGIDDFSPLWAGQNVSGCREIPAADVTRSLASDL